MPPSSTGSGSEPPSRLRRTVGTSDAVVIGLGSMIGAGVFTAFAPAAAAAGSWLIVGLVLAALVAYCNATSSAQLAALYPASGGTYVYGRERLGHVWGHLAGWSFVVGKTASCAAMAFTVGAYAWPEHARAVAVASVVGLAVVNLLGVKKTVLLTRVIVTVVLATLAAVVVVALGVAAPSTDPFTVGPRSPWGVLQSAGFLFFAFAGYARIATLGEEVRDPRQTIPRAIPIALGITVAVYGVVAVAALAAVGPEVLASSSAPLRAVVDVAGVGAIGPVVSVGATVAALGVLLSLMVGVSRTTFAMAAERDLPGWFDAVDERRGVPHRAELAVAGVVVAVVMVADLRDAIGFSSFAVLVYYAVANASAWTLGTDERRWPRWVAGAGVAGCLALALSLPGAAVVGGLVVLSIGIAAHLAARRGVGRQDRSAR